MYCAQRTLLLLACFSQLDNGFAFNIIPKTEFEDSETVMIKHLKSNVEVFKAANEDASKPISYTNTIVVNQNVAQDSIEKPATEDKDNIYCKNNICVYGFENETPKNKQSKKIVTSDVRVIISTDDSDGTKNNNDNEDDVPVIKGYKGVTAEDINTEDGNEVKPKIEQPSSNNGNEQPSVIITNVYPDKTLILNTDKNGVQKPSLYLKPPVYQRSDWKNNFNWKTRIPDRDTTNVNFYSHDNIHGSGGRHDGGYNYDNSNLGHGVRLPSGWSSNWKPVFVVTTPPVNNYHYHRHGWPPLFVTECTCSRKPIYIDDSSRPRGFDPWHGIPETTTKFRLDDKLPRPFSLTQ